MTALFLDIRRFPGRKWLRISASLAHAPHPTPPTRETLVRLRWARQLGVTPADLVLCHTPTHALRACLHALLAPTDVTLLAAPTAPDVVPMVLAVGARFVDVGRFVAMPEATGAWRPGGAALALQAHPEAVALLEVPNAAGGDDRTDAQDWPCRAAIVDWRRHVGVVGPDAAELGQLRAPTLHVLALRDPDARAESVLGAIVAPPGMGDALRTVVEPLELQDHVLDHALGVLEGAAFVPSWTTDLHARIEAHRAAWQRLVADLPAAVPLPAAGMTANLLLLGTDEHRVLRRLRAEFPQTELHFQGGPRMWVTSQLAHHVHPLPP